MFNIRFLSKKPVLFVLNLVDQKTNNPRCSKIKFNLFYQSYNLKLVKIYDLVV